MGAVLTGGNGPRGDMALRALHLCSGYGGFELALRGIARTVAHVERDSYAAATLVARMAEARLDQAPIWSDLTTFDGRPWRGRVDLITAGFPCQPFSAAGKRMGTDDDRWLWPAIATIVRDVGPRFVFLENVPGVVRAGLAHVLGDLADLGFDAEWGLYSAAAAGAPHRRERFWLVAYASECESAESIVTGDGRTDIAGSGVRSGWQADVADTSSVGRVPWDGPAAWRWGAEPAPGSHRFPPRPDDIDGWAEWIAQGGPEPGVRRGADGPSPWLADALHLGGNGLVPGAARAAWDVLCERGGW